MTIARRWFTAAVLGLLGVMAHAGFAFADAAGSAQSADHDSEIDRLLDYLGTSGCEFQRGGTWHDARTAREHLQTKYRYASERSLVQNADQFIDRVATSSSMTGIAYQVRCGAAAPQLAGAWLRAELLRLRTGAAPPRQAVR